MQVMTAGDEAALTALGPRFDLVLVDAPCTGSGTWRRKPDAKWRLKPGNLEQRCAEQQTVLGLASQLVKPGGRLVYVTCSVLPEENEDQVTAFLQREPSFSTGGLASFPGLVEAKGIVSLTPFKHGTDGFFVAGMTKAC